MTLRAIVADDEPVTSRRLQRLLQGWEFDVEVGSDAAEREVLLALQAHDQHARFILQDCAVAVALVHVDIEDGDPFNTTLGE